MKRLIFLLTFFVLTYFAQAQSVDGGLKTLTASGTNNYTITEALPATYDPKERFLVRFTNANTSTTVTLARAGQAPKNIVNSDGSSLSVGQITAGQTLLLSYNGTDYQIVGGGGGGGKPYTHNTQTTDYTLILSDGSATIPVLVEINSASARTLTVPPNASVGFTIGTTVSIAHYGSGTVTVVAGSGVTINSSSGSLASPGQYSIMVLEKRGTDEWYLWNGTSMTSPYWALASGGILTGANTIIGGASNTIKYQFDNLGTTLTNGAGLWMANTQLAASGLQQISPHLILEGQGWKTTATAASQSVKIAQYALPVQGTGNPTVTYTLGYSINGGAYSNLMTVAQMVAVGRQVLTLNQSGVGLGAAAGNHLTLHTGGGGEAARFSTSLLNMSLGSTSNNIAKLYISQAALSSSWIPVLISEPGAHTSMTASTAYVDNDFKGSTHTWSTGTIGIQSFTWFRANTLAGSGGTNTATIGATMRVDPTIVGSNGVITNNYTIYHTGKEGFDKTETATGTTGNQTINKPSGTVNIAASGTSVTVTNNLCTATSNILAVIQNNDATGRLIGVTRSSGSFTIYVESPTSEISIYWEIRN